MVVFGALLLAAGGAYYGYAAKARADLAQLNVTAPESVTSLLDREPLERFPGPGEGMMIEAEQVDLPPEIPASIIASQQLYPGGSLPPDAWTDPFSYEPASYREQVLLQGFTPLRAGQALPVGSQPGVQRIMVPALGIDSGVAELAIRDLADRRTYETPDNVVGHIPQTANGGEMDSAWFFGHLESPIMGEGSVFYRLPEIAELLERGEAVNIITDNGAQQHLYRVSSTRVVHQDDLELYETGRATIHLVACVPSLVYDHRLIVTAELVGVK